MLKLKSLNNKIWFIIIVLSILSSCSTLKNVLSEKEKNIGNGVIVKYLNQNEAIFYFDSKVDTEDFRIKLGAFDQISYIRFSLHDYEDSMRLEKNIFYGWVEVERVVLNYYIESRMNKPIDENKELNDMVHM